MTYPVAERVELPILQELAATGGVEHIRFLYYRLVDYFPQLDEVETEKAQKSFPRRWRLLVQRAGRSLSDKRQLERERGHWRITPLGLKRIGDEALSYTFEESNDIANEAVNITDLSHIAVQQMLCEIGRALGYHAESEYERIDVVWRADAVSERISHAFEVQRKGNIDAALAKLKQAYDRQRSKPFLIVSSETDTNRARGALSLRRTGAFHEIGCVTTILSFAQLQRLHRALTSVEDLLAKVFER